MDTDIDSILSDPDIAEIFGERQRDKVTFETFLSQISNGEIPVADEIRSKMEEALARLNIGEKKEEHGDNILINKVTKSITNDEATAEWAENNIVSIRNAVQSGKHDTVYYPASGTDIMRTLVAYDPSELIVVDSDPVMNEIKRQLEEIGIQPNIKVLSEGERHEVSFELEGKERKIIVVQGDARLFGVDKFNHNQVDVLHIYLPTGAKEAIEHQSGEYKMVAEGVADELTQTNYQMVVEGGFFVFSENNLQNSERPITSLYKIVGLEEKKIVGRHPYTVQTSYYPPKEELESRDRSGYIYQKVKSVEPKVIDVFNKAKMKQSWIDYSFTEFERGNFGFIGIEDGHEIDLRSTIAERYQKLRNETGAIAAEFTDLEINPDLIEKYQQEVLGNFRDKVLDLQRQLKDLLALYHELSAKYTEGEVTDEEAMIQLGIKKDHYGGYKNTKWPLAAQLLLSSSDERSEQVYKIANQFATTQFDFN